MPENTIVLLSGGLDSSTALGMAVEANGKESVLALSILYGQKHKVEQEAARNVADVYGVGFTTLSIDLPKGDSVLMHHEAEMPQVSYAELKGVSPTYVPFRNGTMLSHAAALALDRGASAIWAGMHAEDAQDWAYPDCSAEFIGAMQNAIYVGTYHRVRLIAPFTYSTKADIVRKGIELRVPYYLTHSCYEGRRIACGKCPTCLSRLEAFKANGIVDPIEYEFDQYRKGLPDGQGQVLPR